MRAARGAWRASFSSPAAENSELGSRGWSTLTGEATGRVASRVCADRFTASARVVVERAWEEAGTSRGSFVGTEHLLLGLLRERSTASEALASAGIGLSEARALVRAASGGEGDEPRSLEFSERTKKLLELALGEALALGPVSFHRVRKVY